MKYGSNHIEQTYRWIVFGGSHDIPPVSVDLLEHSSLFWHLSHDIFGGENRLQIEPLTLDFEPLVQSVLNSDQPLFPVFDLHFDRLDAGLKVEINSTVESV